MLWKLSFIRALIMGEEMWNHRGSKNCDVLKDEVTAKANGKGMSAEQVQEPTAANLKRHKSGARNV